MPKEDAVINIKIFKLIFNRAFRLKHSEPKAAVTILEWLQNRITQMLEEEDTYYVALISFELVRVHTLLDDLDAAKVHMDRGESIMMDKFGGSTNSVFVDAYLCKIEYLVNRTLEGQTLLGAV